MPWPDEKIVKAVEKMHQKKENDELNKQFEDLHKYYEEWRTAGSDQKAEKRAAVRSRIDQLFAENNNWEKFSNQLVGFLNGPKENTPAAICKWVEDNYWAMRFLTSNDIYVFSRNADNYKFIFELNDGRSPYFGYIRLARTFLAAHANELNVWGSNDPYEPTEEEYKNWQASNYDRGQDARKLTENSLDVMNWKKLLAGKYQAVNDPKAAEEFNTEFTKIQKQLPQYQQNSLGMHGSYLNRVKAEEKNFFQTNLEELKKEKKILDAGPKAGDLKSMLQWVSQLPAFIARKEVIVDIMDTYNLPISKDMMDIADSWHAIFCDPQARRVLSGGSSAKIIDEITGRRMAEFEEKYNQWAVKNRKPKFSFKDAIKNNPVQAGKNAASVQGKADPANHLDSDRTALAAFAKELKNAKTTFNSNEYDTIISFADDWGSAPKKLHGDTPQKDKAAQLVSIKSVINAYLDHKGKDGVKKNVYNKLAAVEKLNQFVSEKLKDIKEEDLPNAETKSMFRQIQEDSLKHKNIPATYNNKDLIAQKVITAQAFGNNTNADECEMTLKCMDKIISRSEARKDELKEIQRDFFDNPGQKVYSSGKLAVDAIIKGVGKTSIDKSTRQFYENAIRTSQENEYVFDEDDAIAYNYAKKNNLMVVLRISGSLTDCSWKEAEAYTVSVANKAATGDYDRKGILREDITAIKKAAKAHLNKSDVLDSESKFAAAEYNDKELIEKWPDIKFRLGCYKELFKHDQYIGDKVSGIISNYEKMEKRMNKLAQPQIEKMQEEKLHKTNSPKQKSNEYSLV